MKVLSASVVALALLSVCTAGALSAQQKDDRIPIKPPLEQRQDSVSFGLQDSLTESTQDSSQAALTTSESDEQIVWQPVS